MVDDVVVCEPVVARFLHQLDGCSPEDLLVVARGRSFLFDDFSVLHFVVLGHQ